MSMAIGMDNIPTKARRPDDRAQIRQGRAATLPATVGVGQVGEYGARAPFHYGPSVGRGRGVQPAQFHSACHAQPSRHGAEIEPARYGRHLAGQGQGGQVIFQMIPAFGVQRHLVPCLARQIA